MALVHIQQYPNLISTVEVANWLGNKSLSNETQRTVLESLYLLNKNGTDDTYLNKRIEKTHREKIWEMKFKDKSRTEWRILFKKISHKTKPARYALLIAFRKTTPQITKKDLDAAERIAKREGL